MSNSLIFLGNNWLLLKNQLSGIFIKESLDTSFAVSINHQIELVQTKILFAQRINMVLCLAFLFLLLILIGFQLRTFRIQQKANQRIYHSYQVALSDLEGLQKISQQRQKTLKEIHQNIGSQLAYISSALDNLKCFFSGKFPELEDKLFEINSFAKSTLEDFRDSVWVLQKENITLEELKVRLINFIEKSNLQEHDVSFSIEIEEKLALYPFELFDGVTLYKILKETIENAVKANKATQILLQIRQKNNRLEIQWEDDAQKSISSQYTFKCNIQRKVEEIGASVKMVTLFTGTKFIITY